MGYNGAPCVLGMNEPYPCVTVITHSWRRTSVGPSICQELAYDSEYEAELDRKQGEEALLAMRQEEARVKADLEAAIRRNAKAAQEAADKKLREERAIARQEKCKAERAAKLAAARKRKAAERLAERAKVRADAKARGEAVPRSRPAKAGHHTCGQKPMAGPDGRKAAWAVAEALKMNLSTVYYYINRGHVPCVRVDGNAFLFVEDMRIAWDVRHPAPVTEDRDGDIQVDTDSWKV